MNAELVKNIQNQLKDYRAHDGTGSFRISIRSLTDWVEQFQDSDRDFILSELNHILNKCYYTRERTKNHFKLLIKKLSEQLGYSDIILFLKESVFLDCQPEGKSQKAILVLIKELLQIEFNFDIEKENKEVKINYIYVDDILCTGKTFYDNISVWGNTLDGTTKFIDKLRNKKITLSVLYLAAQESAYDKKMGQLYYFFDKNFNSNLIQIRVGRWIDNANLKPTHTQPEVVSTYEQYVIRMVDEYVAGKYPAKSEFYRFLYSNDEEKIFSSSENRIRLENIFLLKGIEILSRANTIKQNIRPLGFTLPSFKNFGFGALFFTWRNVPNNTPLVFWYRGGGFNPLFENVR